MLLKAKQQIKDIPEKQWSANVGYTNGKDCCCFFGHLGRLNSDNVNDYSIDNCATLNGWVFDLFNRKGKFFINVNDGDNELDYQQCTPKARVMAALEDQIDKT